jgi:hypothetical protein
MMATRSSSRTRRDRRSDWAVVGVVALALILGWLVKVYAQGRRTTYTDPDAGITVNYPQHWLLREQESSAFQAVDLGAGDFKTTYQVRVWPVDAAQDVTANLGSVLNSASIARAQGVTAYRLYGISAAREIRGQPTMEARYVYVADSGDPFFQRTPAVVLGLDVALQRGDAVYVFSLLAAHDDFEEAERDFLRFVDSARIG